MVRRINPHILGKQSAHACREPAVLAIGTRIVCAQHHACAEGVILAFHDARDGSGLRLKSEIGHQLRQNDNLDIGGLLLSSDMRQRCA